MTNKFAKIIIKIIKLLFIIFLIIVTLIIIATFFRFSEIEKRLSAQDVNYNKLLEPDYQTNKNQANNQNQLNNRQQLIIGDKNNYSLGADKPKITMVEFADFACPYCKKSFSTIREISVKYSQNIKYIWRDLPIIKPYSINLALAARCAGEQGLFWSLHDKLFIKQGIKEDQEIFLLAKESGVDMDKFSLCYNTKKYLPQIKKDYNDAKSLGIENKGTPIWFINGQEIQGNIPKDVFIKFIENILNN